jgi:hypothetical protein
MYCTLPNIGITTLTFEVLTIKITSKHQMNISVTVQKKIAMNSLRFPRTIPTALQSSGRLFSAVKIYFVP